MTAPPVQHQPDVQAVVPLAHSVGLVENLDESLRTDPADEDHPPGGQRKRLGRDDVARRQLLQALAATMLGGGQAAQAGMDVLRVDHLLQHGQLPAEIARPAEVSPQ